MSERKVLNKYYPPDFDPSKIPRARCPRNRQFTVRLMVPCNIKCYTCGEYIAKGKKFNARKEDVENMTYLGVRIYRFYIKCPGCLAEISFRTDPESVDYVIEAGAHRNFQALKLAEEQAAREEREAKEEIESNPMLLLENRTQQSQYEMEVLESLEDLREMNERHASIDLSKMTDKFESERKLTQEQIEEAERLEALKVLGYEMVDGEMIKRVAQEDLDEEKLPIKKIKVEGSVPSDILTSDSGKAPKQNNMKSKLAGLIKSKPAKSSNEKSENGKESKAQETSNDKPENGKESNGQDNLKENRSTVEANDAPKKSEEPSSSVTPVSSSSKMSNALAFLGAYSDSESGEESN